jgi:hypothetical protein
MDDEPAWAASVGNEVLQIVSAVATGDLPYTTLVTGDWTMANEHLAEAWPLDYPQGESGWQEARYTDNRPTAGVLSTNSMWWRHMSTLSNANRGRANTISKIFLCQDYLEKPISFSREVNLLDTDALNTALKTDPACVACHSSLDPLASYLWGFFFVDYDSALDISSYHPERELWWQDYTEVAPAYYGQPGFTLSDLGEQLASDPGFAECAVEHAWELLLQRKVVLEDAAPLTAHRENFLEDLSFRALFRTILDSPEYRAGPTDDERYASSKLVSPDLLASQIEDLTGYRFVYNGYDMMQTDTYGLRTLAGGIDGTFVTSPATEPLATMVLVQERLAQAAASYALDHDSDRPLEERLFQVSLMSTPDTDLEAMVEEIQWLHLRILGARIEANGPEVEANLALWEDIYSAEADPRAAWMAVLTVLLRDPTFLFY